MARLSSRQSASLALGALAAVLLWRFFPLLGCLDRCLADFSALHGNGLLLFEQPDTRLNAWILAWVQHGLLLPPATWSALFDANAFYPATGTLAGSEHLIGVALQAFVVRIFSQDAIALHQGAVVISSGLLGVTTFACVRWLTGSTWAGAIAAIAAVLMPWRVTELSHIQLLSVQFIPLIWLWVGRLLLGDGGWRDVGPLAAVLALQLLSSFYLAYFLTLSLAVLGIVVALQRKIGPGALAKLAVAFTPAYGIFALSALPYLERQVTGDLGTFFDPRFVFPFGDALSWIAPQLSSTSDALLNPAANYALPLGLVLLALAAPVLRAMGFRLEDGRERSARILLPALWAVVGVSFVLMLGSHLRVAGIEIPLPGLLAIEFLPGFANLRGPARWGIVICLALPLLAGVGFALLERNLPGKPWAGRLLASLIVLLTLSWFQIPARAAWDRPESIEARYAALRALPPGPVLELPWSLDPSVDAELSTRAMLGSTRHWRPILNGYTAYPPRSYALLRRVASRLPEPGAIGQMRRLAGVRWLVVDRSVLQKQKRLGWAEAERAGRVRRAWSDERVTIYEVPGGDDAGARIGRLRVPEASVTLNGISRAPLGVRDLAGELTARLPRRLSPAGIGTLRLRVRNAGEATWPGLDPLPQGLVQLRYTFSPAGSPAQRTLLAPLDLDLGPGSVTPIDIPVTAPIRAGSYRLCVDLVQQQGDDLVPLSVDPVVGRVQVRARERRAPERDRLDEMSEMLAPYRRGPASLPPCRPG